MQTGNNERGIEQAKHTGEQPSKRIHESGVNGFGNPVAQNPADWTNDRMRNQNRQNDGAEGNDDDGNNCGRDLLEEALEIDEDEAGHNRGDDLCLIADHTNRRKAKIPDWNICHRRRSYRVGV